MTYYNKKLFFLLSAFLIAMPLHAMKKRKKNFVIASLKSEKIPCRYIKKTMTKTKTLRHKSTLCNQSFAIPKTSIKTLAQTMLIHEYTFHFTTEHLPKLALTYDKGEHIFNCSECEFSVRNLKEKTVRKKAEIHCYASETHNEKKINELITHIETTHRE